MLYKTWKGAAAMNLGFVMSEYRKVPPLPVVQFAGISGIRALLTMR